ncbi:hypothetical protein DDB_G0291139 [Dictyostelium discoideum AX4]|uniref:Uncharacterized protein n=1 Tax=Dictyostelium discoideum TaxID=44689 RepID=Q54F35_DICDI|nr:hypothetical protein DDB_G0291139 [Dictyostelium discoideum AX4]EAL61853.1 hypothetical protein DDB_G0291139 [Dictyostelium discoideum AX4]|eukprot:XP_635355.1 hypothetical protein DDB_G0291139 [Dictyostelium discoideum AX4]
MNHNEEDIKNIKITSKRILKTVLNAKVGANKIQLKRGITELSRGTESILNLENQKLSILGQLQIESKKLKYLKSANNQEEIEAEVEEQEEVEEEEELYEEVEVESEQIKVDYDKDENYENELKRIDDINDELRLQVLQLSEIKSEQQLTFNRIIQSEVINFISNQELFEDNENEKLFQLIKCRDRLVLRCLELISQIKRTDINIFNIERKRNDQFVENRFLADYYFDTCGGGGSRVLGGNEFQYLKNVEESTAKIIEALIYRSKINWCYNENFKKFFNKKYDSEKNKEQTFILLQGNKNKK